MPIPNSPQCGHFVDFFGRSDEMVLAAACFLDEGFAAGSSCMTLLTQPHQRAMEARLRERGWPADALMDDYRLIMLNASETLASLLEYGRIDAERFHEQFGELIRLLGSGGRAVRITGEMARLLAEYGDLDAVVELEELCNDLSRRHSFDMYCLYCEGSLFNPLNAAHHRRICAVHSGSLSGDIAHGRPS